MVTLADKARFDGAQLIFEEGNTTDSYDAGFLISTLLIFVAKGDGQISHLESGKMIELLSSRLDTHNSVALGRLSGAIMFLASDTKVAQTLREISDCLSPAEKGEVFNMVIELAEVDDDLDLREAEAIHFAGQILGIPRDTIHAKLKKSFAED